MRLVRFVAAGLCLLACAAARGATPRAIIIDPVASPEEILAARETARYLYLRTGRLLPILSSSSPRAETIVVASKGRKALERLEFSLRSQIARLKPQEYLLRTTAAGGRRIHLLVGGDDTGTLYAAYRFAENLGVRFYLHGDTIPDRRIPLDISPLNEVGRPLFALRGIQPFHDFPEGPDWWNRDDYLAYIAQLPKMRMNFFGLHTYPEGGVGPEPGVWLGLAKDVRQDGHVLHGYPSAWANTARPGMWGYGRVQTGRFSCGASLLFDSDIFGPDVLEGFVPAPRAQEQQRDVFDRTARLLHDAFAEARALGVKTCVGTETPLTIPKAVRERMKGSGIDPDSPDAAAKIYEGAFTRIARAYPCDYYWLWTPEDWTWSGNTPEQSARTVRDIRAAYEAMESVGGGMKLATCGWVLGPQNDRAALDRELPKCMPVSAINRQVGHSAVDPAFGAIKNRPKWAIPWMENDPALTAPQLWAGRMRYDAVEARNYGCDGLFGIHWRTKVLAPTVSALAGAAWDQSWAPRAIPAVESTVGAEGGNVAAFSQSIAGTDEQEVYRTVRYGMAGYTLAVPNGRYTVTLKFVEPHYRAAGKRVFGVTIQGRPGFESLDVFAKVGPDRALDYTFHDVDVTDGRMRIAFTPQVEFPCIAGIVVEGSGTTKKIDCGGPGWRDYEPDSADQGSRERRRSMDVRGFYEDFARVNFGPEVSREAGRIFASIDSASLPEPATWVDGPGNIKIDPTPWEKVKPQYAFVDALERLSPRVRGAGNRERFAYWLNAFRYMRCMAEAGCLRGDLDRHMKALSAESEPSRRAVLAESALAARIRLSRTWERMMGGLLQTVSTPGEMGTVANLEQHVRATSRFLEAHDAELAKALSRPLPDAVQVSSAYSGTPRLIVPTVRGSVAPNERLQLKAIVLANTNPGRVVVQWRPMGPGPFRTLPMQHVARGVYQATLPEAEGIGIEYNIVASTGANRLVFPATAPGMNQTVVVNSIATRQFVGLKPAGDRSLSLH